MAVALFATYFTVMGAKCALPSVLSLLTNPTHGLSFRGYQSNPQVLMAQVLATSTMAVAVGKLSLGPLIDKHGGILSLQVCLSGLCLLLMVLACAKSFGTFAVSWVFVDFIFSSCWAGCINAVHQSFPEKEWAGRVGMLAAAARTGNASAFLLFATVLQWCHRNLLCNGSRAWRAVFLVSAALQTIPLTLLYYFGRMTPSPDYNLNANDDNNNEEEEQGLVVNNKRGRRVAQEPPLVPNNKGQQPTNNSNNKFVLLSPTALATLQKVVKTKEFWLHMVSRSALMLFGSFLLFVPTLMAKVYGVTEAQGARVGSIFALGCLVSVSTAAKPYASLPKKRRMQLLMGLMGVATLCAGANLAHVSGALFLSPTAATVSLFLWGLAFAVPFYIPPSLYALERGGKECSATIADAFDFSGFLLLAFFNGYVASVRHDVVAAWKPPFQILTACAATSLVSLGLAVYYE